VSDEVKTMNDAGSMNTPFELGKRRMALSLWLGSAASIILAIGLRILFHIRGAGFVYMALLFSFYALLLQQLNAKMHVLRFSVVLFAIGVAALLLLVVVLFLSLAQVWRNAGAHLGALLLAAATGFVFLAIVIIGIFFYPARQLRRLAREDGQHSSGTQSDGTNIPPKLTRL
jgi:hypothetical protein